MSELTMKRNRTGRTGSNDTTRLEPRIPGDLPAPPPPDSDGADKGLPPDRLLLGGAGAALLAVAGVFGWRELHVDVAYLLTAGAGAGLVLSALLKKRALVDAGLLITAGCGALGGLWYAAARNGALLPGMALALLSSLVFLFVGYPRARAQAAARSVALGLGTLVLTVLSASWSLYFHFLTTGVAVDSVARRLVLTLCWALFGVGLVVASGRLREAAMRYAGYVLVLAATLKALIYDTTHLGGGLRVLVLLAAGVVLIGGALISRAPAAGADADVNKNRGGVS
jgi:hypothetical protein